MSALTTPRPRLRGITWLVVHQHRRLLTVTAALLTVAAVVTAGLRIAYGTSSYDDDSGLFTRFAYQGGLSALADFLANGALLLPLLVAAVVAGPVIGRELESGTYKLAWSQSLPPVRWFTAKIAVPAAAVAVTTVGLTVLFRILWGPVTWDYRLSWYERQVFLASGPTLLAYGLLAVAVGALAGLLVRRTLVAMSVAGLATGTVMVVMAALWGRLWPSVTVERQNTDPGVRYDEFVLDRGLLTSTGDRLPESLCFEPGYEACLARHDVTGVLQEHHPLSHLWPLQLVETGIVLALAAAAVYAALRIFRRRHA
ncbi:ABC transporter permease [Streptomyces pristinaespiralis]|uniref:ABC transporter permease n=1 Tax=Streptomyces pristinaespiralis TaxID=38300 RepID=UPI0033E647DB